MFFFMIGKKYVFLILDMFKRVRLLVVLKRLLIVVVLNLFIYKLFKLISFLNRFLG